MGEEGMENLERKFTCGREPLKTGGQSTFPQSHHIFPCLATCGHLFSPFPLPRGLRDSP